MTTVVRRSLRFRTRREKADYLDAYASLDARHPKVRSFAANFARARGPNDVGGLARDLARFVRDGITYVHDPSVEEFADTATILARGYDDCDGKARAFVALCRAVGVEARIRPVFNGAEFVHVQADVRWPGSQYERGAEPGGWLLAELILKGHRLGQNVNTLPRTSDGRRILS